MLRRLTILSALLLSACQTTAVADQPPKAPPPPPPVQTTKEVLDAAGPSFFKRIPDEDVLVIELKNGRKVAIQLASRFAPVHVANIRAFARGGWWDGATIYRVQEGFVVQWGRNEDGRKYPPGVTDKPPAEYELAMPQEQIVPLGYADAYSPISGFVDGWPVGYDPASGTAALAHCYASVGAGRDMHPDTGAGGELYAIIGHAPRRLDRNIASVGRVIDGFDAMTSLPRGTGDGLGMYTDKTMEVTIARARLAADLPASERPAYEAMDTNHGLFPAYLRARANSTNDFYRRAPGAVDLCGLPAMVRKVEAK